MMTIDEAIRHCRDEADKQRQKAPQYEHAGLAHAAAGCEECANEHEQLAKWLEELLRRREEMAVQRGQSARLEEALLQARQRIKELEALAREAETLRRIAFDAERKARMEAICIRAKSVESTVLEKELARKRAPIIAVDFDGTLCENAWPGIGETKWETVQALVAARAAGARLILWTNRIGARLREAVEWAQARELEFDAINENLPETLAAFTTDCRKVYADIYLDDKAAQPSTAVLEALWETARGVMNGEEEQG